MRTHQGVNPQLRISKCSSDLTIALVELSEGVLIDLEYLSVSEAISQISYVPPLSFTQFLEVM